MFSRKKSLSNILNLEKNMQAIIGTLLIMTTYFQFTAMELQETDLCKNISITNNSSYHIVFSYTGRDHENREKKLTKHITSKTSTTIKVAQGPKELLKEYGIWIYLGGITLGIIKPDENMLLDRWIKECTIKTVDEHFTGTFKIPDKNFSEITIYDENPPIYCGIEIDKKTHLFKDIAS